MPSISEFCNIHLGTMVVQFLLVKPLIEIQRVANRIVLKRRRCRCGRRFGWTHAFFTLSHQPLHQLLPF
ncbi:hypothetical protein HYC85_002225 [Camellia sinensis]|uniref:Uncharacterized protein n=1 Tax=Camellia sinensis TaxID=4442 RepID=A0A7J7I903_CAMSI|nr:hypothetical protein HYC85_002225 [Camellia sinensis]